MKSSEFAKVLRDLNVSTPFTDQFENERDEKGARKYGQKDNRWWDQSTGSQKEHLICWFSRKQYGGSTQKCIDNNFPGACKQCCFRDWESKPEGFGEEQDAQKVFNKMRRPEMFIYIAEVFGVFEEKELESFVQKIKDAIDNHISWKSVVNNSLTWDMIEKKANVILGQA